ncbi:MAG: lipoprotein, partial [Clostridia bacterium]|nr:lipoprotein [Clostridia bacterium]
MKKYLFVFLILLLLTGCNFQNSHSHIQCLECGKCIAVECDGLEEEKCQGHQPVHTHTECQECGKCIAEDCDGAEELKCSGHQLHIFKLTIIDEDNLIYDKIVETNCESETKIVLHSHPLIDADLAMYINGEFYSIQNSIIINDENVWEFSFVMQGRDTTIEFKTQSLEYVNVKNILGIPSLTR